MSPKEHFCHLPEMHLGKKFLANYIVKQAKRLIVNEKVLVLLG
jgi:hypothetical protein